MLGGESRNFCKGQRVHLGPVLQSKPTPSMLVQDEESCNEFFVRYLKIKKRITGVSHESGQQKKLVTLYPQFVISQNSVPDRRWIIPQEVIIDSFSRQLPVSP